MRLPSLASRAVPARGLPAALVLAVSGLAAPLALAFSGLAAPGTLQGQEIIASDRPGIGSGATVLPPGIVQLEVGAEYSEDRTHDYYSIGQALVRIGLPLVELELFANSWVISRSAVGVGDGGAAEGPADEGEGFQDVAIGLKLPLAHSADGSFTLSGQGILTAPTGSDVVTDDEWIPAVNLLADLAFKDAFALSVNAGYQAGPGTVNDVASVIVTPTAPLSAAVAAYVGWAGFFQGGGDSHFAEGGVTWLPTPDVQLDVNGGFRVDRGRDWFFGAGVAVRRP